MRKLCNNYNLLICTALLMDFLFVFFVHFQMWIIINFLIISLISNGLSQPPGVTNFPPDTPVDFMTPPPINIDQSTVRHAKSSDIDDAPTFMQRISRWFYPWGSNANEDHRETNKKIDNFYNSPPQYKDSQTTQSPPTTPRCTPCNKVPWVPMFPFYAQSAALVPSRGQNEYKPQQQNIKIQPNLNDFYQPPPIKQAQFIATSTYGGSYDNKRPINHIEFTTTGPYVARPIKQVDTTIRPYNGGNNYNRPNKLTQFISPEINAGSYDIRKLIRDSELKMANQQKENGGGYLNQQKGNGGYEYIRPNTEFSTPPPSNENGNRKPIKIVSFTTGAPFGSTESYKYSQAVDFGVTSPEYLPPPNLLPLSNEQRPYAPIPIPNLSVTPIPPLYNYKSFHHNPYGTLNKNTINKDVDIFPSVTVKTTDNFRQQQYNNLNYNLPENNHGISDTILNVVDSIPTERDKSIEVVRSIPVAEFTSIVEYPPTVVKTHIIDIQSSPPRTHYGQQITQTVENFSIKPIIVEAHDTHFAASEKKENVTTSLDDKNIFHDFDRVQSSTSTSVTIEESVQTAAEKVVEIKANNNKSNKKDRDTPKNLLDLPIYHTKGRPFTKNSNLEENFTQPPIVAGSFNPSTWSTITHVPTATTTTTPRPSPRKTSMPRNKARSTIVPRSRLKALPSSTVASVASHSGSTANTFGPGPTPSKAFKYASSTKKPKQIQIIIPYTSYHKPMPFKARDERHNDRKSSTGHYVTYDMKSGWSNTDIHDQEYRDAHDAHDAQESKVVTSTISSSPAPPSEIKTTKYLTKVLASSIRELLEKERTIGSKNRTGNSKTTREPFDLMKLQRKIDVWTEQEFSLSDYDLVANKASTIALFGRTKIIPSEYLTTTSPSGPEYATTTDYPTTTMVNYDYDLGKGKPSQQKTSRLFNHKMFDENHIYDSDQERVIEQQDVFHFSRISTQKSTKDLWDQLRIAISPLTNEKVYVVTPVPFAYTPSYYDKNGEMKSARFEIRPNPAAPNAETSALSRLGMT
jgi:hypothetical protein